MKTTQNFTSELIELSDGRMVEVTGTITTHSASIEYWGFKGTHYEGETTDIRKVTDIETDRDIFGQLGEEDIEYLEENIIMADTWKASPGVLQY